MERKILFNQNEIQEICKRLGQEITEKFKNDPVPPVLIGVLKGALPFMMDLIKYINIDFAMDFVQCSSFNGGLVASETLVLNKDVTYNIQNRNVVVVEDIVDSGRTLQMLVDHLYEKNPLNVYTCVLLDKHCERKVPMEADFVGAEVGKGFIVGYGFDYQEYLRNKQEIYIIDDEEYNRINDLVERGNQND